jgi:hypothetical protein
VFWGDSFLFFVEDVVKVSCNCAALGFAWERVGEWAEERRGSQVDAGACRYSTGRQRQSQRENQKRDDRGRNIERWRRRGQRRRRCRMRRNCEIEVCGRKFRLR